MSKLVAFARTQIGVKEVPANSNKTKYGKWFGLDGLPWCGMFVSWCYAQVGAPLGNIGFKKGYAGCQTAVAYFRKNNRVTTNPAPGNIVFFDWNGDGRFDHTGIFVQWTDIGKTFECIEGNTAIGNDSNGGNVMLRTRKNINVLFVDPF
jgi:cell wall-associated NlpC family hydrolase